MTDPRALLLQLTVPRDPAIQKAENPSHANTPSGTTSQVLIKCTTVTTLKGSIYLVLLMPSVNGQS